MYFVEYLYARSRMFWFTLVCVLIASVFLYFVSFPPPHSHINNVGQDVPLNAVLAFGSFFGAIMASMLAATLNRDQSHLAYIWTRPVPRERIAASYMLVDILTIILAFCVAVGIALTVLAVPPQNHLVTDSQTPSILARAIAVPLMVYGVVEVLTSWSSLRLAAIQGVWWPSGIFLMFLSELRLPFPLAQIITGLNWVNPLAYFPEGHGGQNGMSVVIAPEGAHPILLPYDVQTLLAYGIFIAGCLIATYNWKRMEA